jgi:hypothetical protein
MNLRTCGSVNSANHKKDCVHKSQFRKVPHLRKVRKSDKLLKFANFADLRFAELICGPTTLGESSYCVQGTFLKCSG